MDTLRLGTAGILCSRALQGYFALGHIRSALQGYSLVGHCRDTWWLGTAGILDGWARQGYLMVGHGRDTLRLGRAGILGGWSRKSASSRARTTSTSKSNNPTARVGKNKKSHAAEQPGVQISLTLVCCLGFTASRTAAGRTCRCAHSLDGSILGDVGFGDPEIKGRRKWKIKWKLGNI